MARRRRRRRGGVGKELCLQSAAFNVKFNIKASLEAVFVAVLDVLPVGLALHAHLHVVGQVGELHGHQRLQVPRLQELPVVGVVLQGKARVAAHPVVIHCADFVCVFLSLKRRENEERNDDYRTNSTFCSSFPQQHLFFTKTITCLGSSLILNSMRTVLVVEGTHKCCLISTSQHASARKRAFLYLKPQTLYAFGSHHSFLLLQCTILG